MLDQTRSDSAKQTQRLEAFSDGVFAIAITLLVLEIRLPEGEGHLAERLLSLWPTYLAYITSFITIAVMWANHDSLFRLIKYTDRGLMLTNAVLLCVITFLNFPTVVLAEYLQSPDGTAGAVLYAGTLLVIALLYNLVWRYAVKAGLLDEQVDQRVVAGISGQYWFGPAAYLAATLVGLFSVIGCLLVCLGLVVYFALAGSSGRHSVS